MTADRVIKARRTSTCRICHQLVRVGDRIGRTPTGWAHVGCIIERGQALAILAGPGMARIDPTAPEEPA
jgi:hypothetical protein